MPVIGFGFRKINIERNEPTKEPTDVKVNTDFKVEDIRETERKPYGKVLNLTFTYNTRYLSDDEELGYISFETDIVYTGSKKEMDSLLKTWKKERKVEGKVAAEIIQFGINRCILEAVSLSLLAGLPSPIPLPKIQQ